MTNLKSISKLKYYKLFVICLFAYLLICLFAYSSEADAQSRVKSDNYQITWPNLNMGAGLPSSDNYKLGVTTGQMAPGLYSGTGYKVRAGFQYIHSIIPFTFQLDKIAVDFGSLTINSLTENEEAITLTVNSGSAGGYQVTTQENNPLTSTALSTIDDTTCDGDTCTHIDSGTWTDTSTYGFGYTMSGDDVPLEFASGTKFKNFADVPNDVPQNVMGLIPATAGRGKTSIMTMRINISGTQAAGVYENIIAFIATPTY